MECTRTLVLAGDYDYEYPRERSLKRGLEDNGVTIRECRYRDEPIFVGMKKLLLLPLFYARLGKQLYTVGRREDVDAILLTKFNALMLPVTALFARLWGVPLAYDLFVSLARTGEIHDYADWKVRAVYLLERVTLPLTDVLLTETDQFVSLYAEYYDLPESKLRALPVGADEEWFYPLPNVDRFEEHTVLYWGNFLPHHGVGVILDAADRLRDTDVRFLFLGDGPERERAETRAEELSLPNVEFRGRVPMEELQESIGAAQVCLGIFADDPRADASVTNKVSEGVAMGRPVVTERTPAIEQWFTHGEDIHLVPPEDAMALVDAIEQLRDETYRRHLGDNARKTYEANFTEENIGRLLVGYLGLT